jgi:hypothetical protein
MARNEGSSMENGSKFGHSKYKESGLETAPERWEAMLANCEITLQTMWLIANSREKGMNQRHHLEFMVS